MRAKYKSGKLRVMEPEKCERWGWFGWSNLPKLLFTPIRNLVNQHYNPFEK